MNKKFIYSVHIYILLIMSTGFMLHVFIVPSVLTSALRDSWITVVASILPFVIWTTLVFYLYKKFNNEDVVSLMFKVMYKPLAYLFSSIFVVYFLLSALVAFRFTLIWANLNYTEDIPDIVVVFLISLICFYAALKGIRTIATVAFLVLPFVVLFGFLVGIGNIKNKDYGLLFPIFEKGYHDFFHGFIYTCSGFFEIILLLFLNSFLKDKVKVKWLILVSFILLMLILGPLTGAIMEFGSHEAEKMRNPVYEQWKLLTLGVNITRLDFFSIFQWLSGAFIRISLNLFIANYIINYSGRKKWSLPALSLLVSVAVMIPWNATSFYYFLQHYYFPINLIFLLFTLLLFLAISKLKVIQYGKRIGNFK
ncbi:GerAB/ArcD/ProY family transporter [Gottfriedia acidiceleris]|uniref:Spore germination protein n=1 Tax=Gottfriedia acidiceleris TaxID=371036 RepID=A0ABY4JN44_9BACI|nr:endospore germination permease [Gottfriedia acidiceleris]UPM53735.1 spore germination protein [Gottfriedia acidiceleris]